MAFTLSDDLTLNEDKKDHFYTDDEQALLYQLENGLVKTKSNDQVMENLRRVLGLTEK